MYYDDSNSKYNKKVVCQDLKLTAWKLFPTKSQIWNKYANMWWYFGKDQTEHHWNQFDTSYEQVDVDDLMI